MSTDDLKWRDVVVPTLSEPRERCINRGLDIDRDASMPTIKMSKPGPGRRMEKNRIGMYVLQAMH